VPSPENAGEEHESVLADKFSPLVTGLHLPVDVALWGWDTEEIVTKLLNASVKHRANHRLYCLFEVAHF
jgi:hypothetical protein